MNGNSRSRWLRRRSFHAALRLRAMLCGAWLALGTAAAGLPPAAHAGPAPVVAAMPSPGEPGAEVAAAERHYELFLGGVRLAEIALAAERTGARYRARFSATTGGALAWLYEARIEARAEGRVEGGDWIPERFAADTADARKRQAIEMRYDDGRPVALSAEPPFQPKPWEIEPGGQAGTADPLSAFLALAEASRGTAPCDRAAEIYDGRRRYRLTLGPAEREAGLWRCEAVYARVAGFKPKQLRKPDVALTLWYADGPEGARLERASTDTPLGMAVLLRR